MAAIGRALLNQPRVLLCDEISLGLAPKVIREIYAALPEIRTSGTAMVLVEQDVGLAKSASDRLYCMLEGRVTLTGASTEISRDEIQAAYFGASHAVALCADPGCAFGRYVRAICAGHGPDVRRDADRQHLAW